MSESTNEIASSTQLIVTPAASGNPSRPEFYPSRPYRLDASQLKTVEDIAVLLSLLGLEFSHDKYEEFKEKGFERFLVNITLKGEIDA